MKLFFSLTNIFDSKAYLPVVGDNISTLRTVLNSISFSIFRFTEYPVDLLKEEFGGLLFKFRELQFGVEMIMDKNDSKENIMAAGFTILRLSENDQCSMIEKLSMYEDSVKPQKIDVSKYSNWAAVSETYQENLNFYIESSPSSTNTNTNHTNITTKESNKLTVFSNHQKTSQPCLIRNNCYNILPTLPEETNSIYANIEPISSIFIGCTSDNIAKNLIGSLGPCKGPIVFNNNF